MSDTDKKLLSTMIDLKVGQAEIASDVTHIKDDVEETKESIKLVHGRINKVEERADNLEGWRDVEYGKGKAWKIIGAVVTVLAAAAGILAITGVFN